MKNSLRACAVAVVALLGGCTTIGTTQLPDTLASSLRGQGVAIVMLVPSPIGLAFTLTATLAVWESCGEPLSVATTPIA